MTAGRIVTSSDSGIARLVLHSPERRNAVSVAMWEAIAAFATDLAGSDTRLLVLEGEGGHFSAGADIGEFDAARADCTVSAYDDRVEAACRAIEELPMPTLALVRGYCLGGGLLLAAACDFRIAHEGARLGLPAARLGLGCDIRGAERLMLRFGGQVTRRLLLTAAILPTADALALGLLDEIVDAEDEARWMAMLAGNAPLTIAAGKLALRGLATGDAPLVDEARDFAARANASADYEEGRAAFRERRPPRFTGR